MQRTKSGFFMLMAALAISPCAQARHVGGHAHAHGPIHGGAHLMQEGVGSHAVHDKREPSLPAAARNGQAAQPG